MKLSHTWDMNHPNRRLPGGHRWLATLAAVLGALFFLPSDHAHAQVGGGGTTTFTTSTTTHTTVTETNTGGGGGTTREFLTRLENGSAFDFSLDKALGDPAVRQAVHRALWGARQELETASQGDARIFGIQGLTITKWRGGGSRQLQAEKVSQQFSVTTTQTLGPGITLIGPEQSVTYFVPAGTTNINTNTHTETFLDRLFSGGGGSTLRRRTDLFLEAEIGGRRVLILDYLPVLGTYVSGLPTALAQRGALIGVHDTAIRDLNGRLFRLRGGNGWMSGPGGDADFDSGGKDTLVEADAVAPPVGQIEWFVSGDFGQFDSDPGGLAASADGDTWAGSVGVEFASLKDIVLGLGITGVESDQDLGNGLGGMDIDGVAVSGYASWTPGPVWLDVLYSYGHFQDSLHRQTLTDGLAFADPDSSSHAVSLNGGWNLEMGRVLTGPYAGLRYLSGDLDGYRERGGGREALAVEGQDYESLVTELGWQVSLPISTSLGRVTPQLRAVWERENLADDDTVGAQLTQSPFGRLHGGNLTGVNGVRMSGRSGDREEDWLSLSAGVLIELNDWSSLILDYEENFRGSGSERYAGIRASFRF